MLFQGRIPFPIVLSAISPSKEMSPEKKALKLHTASTSNSGMLLAEYKNQIWQFSVSLDGLEPFFF